MQISEFSAWLDNLLEPKMFKDYCVDGLCVEASDKVTRIVTGVSFRDRLIDAAIENKADCIIVHHPNDELCSRSDRTINLLRRKNGACTHQHIRKL